MNRHDFFIMVVAFVTAVLMGLLGGCTSFTIEYPGDRINSDIRQAQLNNPEYTLQVVQHDRHEMQKHFGRGTCGYITKIPSVNYCLINVLENSSRTVRINLNACFNEGFTGDNPPGVKCL